MINNFDTKIMTLLLANIIYIGVANYAVADDSFSSIGGYSLGQPCSSGEFSYVDSSVSNPNDVMDYIKVKKKIIKKKIEGGYELEVFCDIIDNKVYYIDLTATNFDDISLIQESLKEKMGRPADDSKKANMEPVSILGKQIDGNKDDAEYWFLSNNREASVYTFIEIPYGISSISDWKVEGGISIMSQGVETSQWEYLKKKGLLSTKQQKALKEKKKRKRIRSLLE